MPANPHPFQHPDPVQAQAARDKAMPMAPRAGERALLRNGELVGPFGPRGNGAFPWCADDDCWVDSGSYSRKPGKKHALDIIAAVDATGRVTRTAEGVVPSITFDTTMVTGDVAWVGNDPVVFNRREERRVTTEYGPPVAEAPERIWADTDGVWRDFDPSEIKDVIGEYIRFDLHEAAIASARALALEEAAREAETCDYPWASPTNEQADACNEMAERIAAAIRALSATLDTIGPVIEAAKAVVHGTPPTHIPRKHALDALRDAIAAHEARHG